MGRPGPGAHPDLALDLPERAARADGRRLVLFFDEFQEVASERRPYGDPDLVTKRMRAAFQRSPSVSFLFAGSLEHVMRDLFAPGNRAFSGFGSFHRLHPIAAEDWSISTWFSSATTPRSTATFRRWSRPVEHIRRLHKNALRVARALARGESVPRQLPPAIRDRMLKLLMRAGIVEHVARADWRIVDPLFQAYLRDLDPLG